MKNETELSQDKLSLKKRKYVNYNVFVDDQATKLSNRTTSFQSNILHTR